MKKLLCICCIGCAIISNNNASGMLASRLRPMGRILQNRKYMIGTEISNAEIIEEWKLQRQLLEAIHKDAQDTNRILRVLLEHHKITIKEFEYPPTSPHFIDRLAKINTKNQSLTSKPEDE